MVRLTQRGIAYISDMKKRLAKEFGMGLFTKEEFDQFLFHCDELEKIIGSSKNRKPKN